MLASTWAVESAELRTYTMEDAGQALHSQVTRVVGCKGDGSLRWQKESTVLVCSFGWEEFLTEAALWDI